MIVSGTNNIYSEGIEMTLAGHSVVAGAVQIISLGAEEPGNGVY